MMKQKEKKTDWWSRKTTGQKASYVISILLFLISIFVIVFVTNLRAFGQEEAADKLYGDGVGNGWVSIGKNIAASSSAMVGTVVTIAVSFLLIFLVNLLTRLFSGNGRRSRTIGALIRSLTKYVVILAAIAVILGLWGVDVQSILAGVGIVTLIIGLGCQTLIQDVVAGLFIVFDDYFAVGDIVIIDGFRGTVSDIGLKSTKITDAGGNIKAINNSSITTVVNLSRMDSLVTVSMAASYNEDPVRVEGLLLRALPKIQAKIPQITDTLTYKGISEIGDSDVSYLVICHCKEANRFQVTRDLNRELLLLFIQNDIQFVFPQITVNQPNPVKRPATTEAQKKLSAEAIEKMRALPPEPEKERFAFLHHAKDVMTDEVKGLDDTLKGK